jgi:hypothetical protein
LQNLYDMDLTARDIDRLASGWDETPEAEAVSDAFESMDIQGSGNYPGDEVAAALARAIEKAGQNL